MKKGELRASLAIPSTVHTYSVITEYISKWFLSKWSDEFFKTVHIEGKHVFDDYRKFDFSEVIKKGKPMLAILPKINLEFDRDALDTNMFGLDLLIERGRLDNAVIKDYENNIFLGMDAGLLDLEYGFKIRVEGKAQQIDMFKYMTMAFRVGHRFVETIDLDYHIPQSIMIQMAKDLGYTVEGDKIIDIVKFLNEVNSKSELPILFKLRTINQKMEFFLRFTDVDISIDIRDRISYDDGERDGQLFTNFHIEMQLKINAPSPKLYIYYSPNESEIITVENTIGDNSIYVEQEYGIVLSKFPEVNDNGWNQYLITDYYEDNIDEPIEIDFSGLFKSLRLDTIIEHNNSINVDSSQFISFYLINGILEGEELPYTMDWTTCTMTIDVPVTAHTTKIGLYVDTEFTHSMRETIEAIDDSRFRIENINR